MAVEQSPPDWDSFFSSHALPPSLGSTSTSLFSASCWSPIETEAPTNVWGQANQNWSSRSSDSRSSSDCSSLSPKEPVASPYWSLPPQTHSPPASSSSSTSSYAQKPDLMDEFLRLTITEPSVYTPPASMLPTPSTFTHSPAAYTWEAQQRAAAVAAAQQQPREWDWQAAAAAAAAAAATTTPGASPLIMNELRARRAKELAARLEECSEEYRQLEKERKQTEAELARHNLGKRISSSNGMPIPRLPTAPSRVDRLVVDFFREHARLVTLLSKMEQLRGECAPAAIHTALSQLNASVQLLQQCRLHERAAILQQLRGDAPRSHDDETLALTHALTSVLAAATRARAANWCSLITTIKPADAAEAATLERIVASDYRLPPPPIRSRPM